MGSEPTDSPPMPTRLLTAESQPFHQQLASFLVELRRRLAEPDALLQHQLRLVWLDTAATALANLSQPELVALQRLHGRLAPGACRLPGFCTGLTPAGAVLVLGASACWDELVEGYAPAHGRPALHGVPVAMGLGRSLGQSLESLFLSYELGARLGEAYRVPPGEHVDGTWGTAVAALAAAVLLEIGASGELEAVTAALCQMSRSLFASVREGASCRLLVPGLAASRGMDLAVAAAAGFRGPQALAADPVLLALAAMPVDLSPRRSTAISAGYVKLLPGARHLHYAAAAAKAWLQRHGGGCVDPSQPGSNERWSSPIQLRTYPEAIHYCGQPAPTNRIQAQFSLAFAVAATLRWGEMGREQFTPEALLDDGLQALLGRIELIAVADQGGRWAELVLADGGGTLRSARVDGLPGDPGLSISDSQRLCKARELLAPVLGGTGSESLINHWLEAPAASPLWPLS
jgi:2-methylcitrate dehydratase PrpD